MHRPSPVFQRFVCIGPAAVLLVVGAVFAPEPILAQPTGDALVAPAVPDIERHITEAARRFGLPRHWIRAVIAVESAGDPLAVSRAGAMGLMQVMPGTWAELRAAHRLGDDPFDPRASILAGTAYLREMHDRFGAPGFLAAYNAGRGRYAEHLATGRPLPRETQAYVAALAPIIGGAVSAPNPPRMPRARADWRDAPLFAGGPGPRTPDSDAPQTDSDAPAHPGLFVPLQPRRTP